MVLYDERLSTKLMISLFTDFDREPLPSLPRCANKKVVIYLQDYHVTAQASSAGVYLWRLVWRIWTPCFLNRVARVMCYCDGGRGGMALKAAAV